MPTVRSSPRARSRAARADRPLTRRGASATWAPTVITGSSALSVSWKIMASWCRRRSVELRSPREVTSSPATWTVPACTLAVRGSRPMIARSVMLLPLPDSPTMPSEPPAGRLSDTPSTARNLRWCRRTSTVRSLTSSSGLTAPPAAGLTAPPAAGLIAPPAAGSAARSLGPLQVGESVAEQREADAGDDDRDARDDGQPRVHGDEGLAVADHRAPVRRGRLDAEAQVTKGDDGQDDQHDVRHYVHDGLADGVGQDVPEQHPRPAQAAAF